MKGLIFDIKRFAIHDGPGIRTTVFFKGCPLSCHWCHNPESRSCFAENYIDADRIGEKIFTRHKIAGRHISVDELLLEVEKDLTYYDQSSGGLTCSGGEPLMQPEFLRNFLMTSKRNGIHTVVDTSGYAKREIIERIIPETDLFLYDLKLLDDGAHLKFTGVSNKQILENFDLILRNKKKVIARIPIIPGVNDAPEDLEAMANYVFNHKSETFKEVHLLPYHNTGQSKYLKFRTQQPTSFVEPEQESMRSIFEMFTSKGLDVKIGG